MSQNRFFNITARRTKAVNVRPMNKIGGGHF